jgi:gas vesicle protein
MRNGFMKGVMIGGLVAASVGLMMNTDMMSGRTRKRMMRSGKNLLRKSGHIISDVADLFR